MASGHPGVKVSMEAAHGMTLATSLPLVSEGTKKGGQMALT